MISRFFVKQEYRQAWVGLHHGENNLLNVGRHVKIRTGLRRFRKQNANRSFELMLRRNMIRFVRTWFLARFQ